MRKWIVAGIVAVLAVGGGIILLSSSGESSDANPVLITAVAVPRDLTDEATVQGTLGRVEERTINSASEAAQVSAVYLKDGAEPTAGQAILALDGRDSVTTVGKFPYFRKLDVGAEGADVEQLESTLATAGYSPGTVDQKFTTQTRFALAQWQAGHGYPGAAPSTSQAVQVALVQGSGYKLGDQTTAGLQIGAPATRTAAHRPPTAINAAFHAGEVGTLSGPKLSIVPSAAQVPKGTTITFTVRADVTTASPIDFNLSFSGSADNPNDVVLPSAPFTLPANASSTTIQVLTRQNGLVEADKTITASVQSGSGYDVGSPASASTTIASSDLPELTLTGTTTVQQGGTATLTVTADQAPLHNTQVALTAGGSAVPGTDYVAFPPTVTIPAGRTSAAFTVTTKTSTTVKPDRLLVVSLAPSGTAYTVGPVNTATVTIAGTSGDAAIPVVSITAGSLRTPAGTPATFSVGIDRALTDELTVQLTYGGNAVAGSDYTVPGGLVTIPPGMTSTVVNVPTLDNGKVQVDPALFVGVVPSPAYTVGTPSLAGVLIVSSTLPKLNIVGGPSAVGLGGGAVFTVVADQPPVKDISVQYTVTGTAQQGKDLEPVTGTVIMPAGQTTATIPILTLNTNVFFLPTDMIAGTWPTRLGEVFVKEGDIAVAGTPLFNLTETAFTVTLDATASDRTKLKVGQKVTVQLQGGTDTAPGVITELDDTATTDKESKKQSYQGKVQVQGTLGAADGAPVTIKVVVQEELGALTVPIAAVKQNGSGDDVVRVISLADGGKITETKVTTGLSEGSYIQIKSGLEARQVVVVQVDKGSG